MLLLEELVDGVVGGHLAIVGAGHRRAPALGVAVARVDVERALADGGETALQRGADAVDGGTVAVSVGERASLEVDGEHGETWRDRAWLARGHMCLRLLGRSRRRPVGGGDRCEPCAALASSTARIQTSLLTD